MSSSTPPTDVVQGQGQGPPEVRPVRLAGLSMGYSPRQQKLDEDHVQALVEVIDRVPPIIVDERTMRVLDGVHRMEAARRAGRAEIRAVFFSGGEAEALVVAVQANVRHGKPLSRAERQAAAAAILRACPDRSDRWVGEVCGLSHTTVARVREAAGAMADISRTGRDGRRRPVDPARGQAALAKLFEGAPETSLREAAKAASVAPSTAQRAAAQARGKPDQTSPSPYSGAPPVDLGVRDELAPGDAPQAAPGNRGTGAWLARTAVALGDLDAYLADVPIAGVPEMVVECRRRARTWATFADALAVQLGRGDASRPGEPD